MGNYLACRPLASFGGFSLAFPKMLILTTTAVACTMYIIKIGKVWIIKKLNLMLGIYKRQLEIRRKLLTDFNSAVEKTSKLDPIKVENFIFPQVRPREPFVRVTLDLIELSNELQNERLDRTLLNELKSEIRSLKGILLTRKNLFPVIN